jgi:hypothetical protein
METDMFYGAVAIGVKACYTALQLGNIVRQRSRANRNLRERKQTIKNRFGDDGFLHYEPGNRVENNRWYIELRYFR